MIVSGESTIIDYYAPFDQGLSNTPYLGRDVMFLHPPCGLCVVSAHVFEALLEVSKLTVSFLKGLVVALCIYK